MAKNFSCLILIYFFVRYWTCPGTSLHPLIGSASDHCNSSYGRRRPFIWLLSLGVLLALFIIPHADVLAANLSWGNTRRNQALQVGLLILGVGLLDFCGQVCFTPLEALLSDLYRERDDCGQAFAMFSFMVSLGGCVGYLLPALDWSGGLLSFYLGGQAECLFSLLILIFVVSVLVTMKVSEEPLSTVEPGPSEPGRCFPRSCCYLFQYKLRALKSGPLICLLRTCWSHDTGHLSQLLPRAACHATAVFGTALQLDGCHVLHALLYRFCRRGIVRRSSQRRSGYRSQATLWWRLVNQIKIDPIYFLKAHLRSLCWVIHLCPL